MILSPNNIIVIINLIILIVSIILVLIYSHNKFLKITFVIFDFGLLIWLLSLLFYYSPAFENILLIIGRINFTGLLITSIGYYFFIRFFIKPKSEFSWNIADILISIISSSFIPVTLFTGFIAENEIVLANNSRETLYGRGYLIYLAIIFINLVAGLLIAIKNYKKSSNQLQKQIKLFLAAILISMFFGAITNIVFPLMGIFDLQPYGSLALMILNISMVILILRYQFLNIRVLIGRLIYFLIIQLFILSSFYIAYLLMNLDFIQRIPIYKIVIPFLITLPISLIFDKINNFMKKQVRTRFINPGYDPYEVIDEFNNKILMSTDLEEIQKEFIKTIKETLRPSNVDIFLYSDEDFNNINLKELEYFKENSDDPIIYDFEEDYLGKPELLRTIINYMREEDFRVILPLKNQEKILGYVRLGKKDLDSTFTQYDIEFLKNLSGIMSLSITRAQLYKEVKLFNQSLQHKVDEQTKELQQKVQQLQEARRKEADMIDIMGHELRTPMSIVKLNADLLHNFRENVPTKKEEYIKYVSRIKDAVDTEIKLINTLLSSAKLEGNKIELNLEKVNIIDQIKMSIHAQEKRAKEKGIELITKYDKNSSFVYSDHARTVEILNNLIDNAVKYTDKGSVTVTTKDLDKYIEISIKDTGEGMTQEDISKLGQKFFRTGNYIKSQQSDDFDIVRPGGTGLGLYVTFSLIKKMGGDIKVDSKLGEGSTFTFTLPKYEGQEIEKRHDTQDMFERMGLKQ